MDAPFSPQTAPKHRVPRCAALSLLVLLAAGLSSFLGCKEWSHGNGDESILRLPANRLAPDAVGIELGVVQLDETQAEDIDRFWRVLDEQEIPLAIRKLLDANGLRVGVMSSRPPSVFADLIFPRPINIEELTEFQRQLYIKGHLTPESRMVGHTKVSTRNGQNHPVATSPTHGQLSWTVENDGLQSVGAGRLVNGVFSIAAVPNGDGSVRMIVTPQIHHGEQKKRFGGSEHGFKFVERQTVQSLEDLRFEVVLRAGESLVIGPTADIDALGHLFFGNAGQSPSEMAAGVPSEEVLAPTMANMDPAELAKIDATLDELANEVFASPDKPLDNNAKKAESNAAESRPADALADQIKPASPAEALLAEEDVLLLDENLNPISREEAMALLQEEESQQEDAISQALANSALAKRDGSKALTEILEREASDTASDSVDREAFLNGVDVRPSKPESEMTDQERLEEEVREMLRVQPGEEAVLPEFYKAPNAAKPNPLHRLLLIRVVQTQMDELFRESESADPLTNVNRY